MHTIPHPHLDNVLERLPELRLELKSSDDICILVDNESFHFGPHALSILDAFAQPQTLHEALHQLKERVTGGQDWVDLTSTIFRMYEAGILHDESRSQPKLSSQTTGYDAAPIHAAMLNDKTRTSRYLNAIQKVVQPGDVVVDVGTGTGILAIGAARAGARHVYAIEASGIGKIAQEHFEANGLADRITLISGWSTRIRLPELADVMVSEMVGNEPLQERVLEITVDACERLLKPNARLVPDRLKVFGLPVTIPPDKLVRHTVTMGSIQNWEAWYGIDFNALAAAARQTPHQFSLNPYEARDWHTLSAPVLLADLDLKTNRHTMLDYTYTDTATTSGILNGLLVYFELDLGPTTRLSTHPAVVEPSNHWLTPVWVLLEALSLEAGDCFKVRYRYRADGIYSDVHISPA